MKDSMVLDSIQLAEDSEFEAAWLRLPSIPLEEHERNALCAIVHKLEERVRLASKLPLTHEVYLQMTQIERPAGPLLLSKNGPRWLPSPGVGVWPDKDPPRSMTARDLEALIPGEKMAEFSHQVLRLNTRDDQMRVEAIETLLGTGPVLFMLVSEAWTAARRSISAWLERGITEESFRGHPFYVPLLDGDSLKTLTSVQLSTCLDGVTLYLREDVAERAILIIWRTPLSVRLEDVCIEQLA
jgi:hypothetical protein